MPEAPIDKRIAVGALLGGLIADAYGIRAAVWTVAALTAFSGIVVAVRMYETHRSQNSSRMSVL